LLKIGAGGFDMVRRVAGYFIAAVILNLFSGFLRAVESDCPACYKFGIQQFSEKKMSTPFSLKMADGNQGSLSDFKGKPIMFTFWASW
jgi:cytochrome oxidase Cu insertion factor (SCO1/SenC/PrrC family)